MVITVCTGCLSGWNPLHLDISSSLSIVSTEWWGAGVVICLERGADLHMPSWCHCHSLSLASVKSRLVLPFWYRPSWVVLEKGPLNGCDEGGRRVHSKKLYKRLSRLDTRKYVFANKIIDQWNSLPDACVNSTTLNQFKSHISKILQPEVRTQSRYSRK